MTEKELRDNLLFAIYKNRDNLNIFAKDLCLQENIAYENINQLNRAISYLIDHNYITAVQTASDDGAHIRSLNYKGLDHVEDMQLKVDNSGNEFSNEVIEYVLSLLYPLGGTRDSLLLFPDDFRKKDKANKFEDEKMAGTLKYLSSKKYIEPLHENEYRILPDGMKYFETLNHTPPPYYLKAEKNLKSLVDKNTEPCMGIENLATSFIELLGSLKENDSQMLGIFGPWGRGKTYFFNYVKSEFAKRSFGENLKRIFRRENKPRYTAIEFNAWKYQETPAIWAYLFETIFRSFGNSVTRFLYSTILRRLRDIIIFAISVLFGWLLYCIIVNVLPSSIDNIKNYGVPTAWLIAVISFFRNFVNNPFSSYKLIKKYTNGLSFNSELGIQSEIEKELEALFKYWICKKSNRKIVLFIDDIDRCSEHTIISIIDSLRTILENEEIRKRLIVVCAIDDAKLVHAIKHKYSDLYNEITEVDELAKLSREQMDKVFLSGIKLRPINNEDKSEFLQKLIFDKTKEKDSTRGSLRQYPMDGNLDDVSTSKLTYNILSDDNEFTLLNGLIIGCDKEITPRQIRIVYYRFILARNILHGDTIPIDKIAKAILERSLGNKDYKDDELAKSYWDVVDTVVCY